jgi:ribonuclease-3
MSVLEKLLGRRGEEVFFFDDEMDEKRIADLKRFCRDNEVKFADLSLIDTALTHSSYANEAGYEFADYERLEFLGDAVIELVVVEYLYNEYPEMNEGDMTKIKSDVVSQSALSEVAKNLGLSRLLNLGKSEVLSRGRRKPSILSDAFESVVGALYLSGPSEQTESFILANVEKRITDLVRKGNIDNYKSLLQKRSQRLFSSEPTYRIVARGDDARSRFTAEVVIQNKPYGRGSGRNKKEAEMRAAQKTLKMLRKKNGGRKGSD